MSSSLENIFSYLLPFKIGDPPLESARSYLCQCQGQLRELHQKGFSSSQIVGFHSFEMDHLLRTLFERVLWLFQESDPHKSTALTLLATGGYGRQEMNPHSDVDLLFVYSEKPEEFLSAVIDSIIYPLWDCGLEVGYAVRSLEDCKRVFKEDISVATSLLDARFLAGDSWISEELLKTLQSEASNPEWVEFFIQGKIREKEGRLARYGDSIYLLEPNIKESEGGLRDFQMLEWFAKVIAKSSTLEGLVQKGFLNAKSLNELLCARNFLWRIRNALHLRAGKKSDQLTFEHQKEIAKEFGYQDSPGALAVEKFMQDYYYHAANIKRIAHLAIGALTQPSEKRLGDLQKQQAQVLSDHFAKIEGKVFALDPDCFRKDPSNLIRIFLLAQKENLEIYEQTAAQITEQLEACDEALIGKEETGKLLKEFFCNVASLGNLLEKMHDLKLLEKLIPEFAEVVYRVQHDAYHVYTVDVHSIVAMKELSKLAQGEYDREFPQIKKAFESIERKDLLAWGLFFHDVGKGRGKNHSIIGAEMAVRAAQRIGYSDREIETIEFLVKSHLLMPHLSQRRDLDDPHLIQEFAKAMGGLEHLRMLYVLTWADIRAVGPKVWTPWKGTLLSELYMRSEQIFETSEESEQRIRSRIEQVQAQVVELFGDQMESFFLQNYFKNLPEKYFLTHPPEEIFRHLKLIFAFKAQKAGVEISVFAKENVNELLIYTPMTPVLLAKVTGTMAVNDLNILEAKQYLLKNGEALLILRFTDAEGEPIFEERRFENLKRDLKEVLEQRVRVRELIEQRRKPFWSQKKLAQELPNRVEIDNDVSAYYTVIDLYTRDRVGLLYQVFSSLSNLGLYTDVSKISTKVDQVADVFYVKGIFGEKILQPEKLKRIRSELLRVLEGEGL